MKAKLINEEPVTYVAIFESGEEVIEGLKRLAVELELGTSQIAAIGAFSEVMLGYFNFEKRDYKNIPVTEQVEVLSLLGDITSADGEPEIHAHVVIGRSDGSTMGGHLISAYVRPTLEVIITESPAHLKRSRDEETGLLLIDLEKQE